MAIEIRPVSGYSDLEQWVDARNEVFPDDPDTAAMMALVRASELEHVDLLAYENGAIVGTGMLAGDLNSLESSHPYVEVSVPTRFRGHGVGSALLRELSGRVRRQGKEGIDCEARADDDYSIAYLMRRGFVERGRSTKYVLELGGDDGGDPDSPNGIELTTLADRPDLVRGMYEVAKVTYPEIGGYQARHANSFNEWQLYQLGSPQTTFEMTPIALDGEQVVGFATMLCAADGKSAEHGIAAVLPSYRKRGIATALLRAQIAEAKRASIETLIAWNRSDRASGVYAAKLGFEPSSATIGFRGPLL